MKSDSDKTNHPTIQSFSQEDSFSSQAEEKKNRAPKGLSLRPNRSVHKSRSFRPKPMLPLRSIHKEDTEGL